MPQDRFYVDSPLKKNETVALDSVESHHLIHVMRGCVGDTVELVNGEGSLGEAEVMRVTKREAFLKIKTVTYEPAEKNPVIIAQAIPKINRLENIIEKATELGMDELWLFPGEKGEKNKLSEGQLGRATSIAISAMKQCGRLYLPKIVLKPALKEWAAPLPYASVFGDLSESAPLLMDAIKGLTGGLIFFTGPESGFSKQEEERLKELGSKGVKLHKNILRTDTASIAAIAIIRHLS